ncbi:RMD1 family protein [Leptolyngbya cf. ectocarpi LEGE 11479]|uniref:RMD1 family protein n=1 Tax=Leptolyngbya cf. ectocarpi LEGE 11479 TaxID=1828722 RepID=A0A928ZTE8_LEPEC|nr:RMD1 family protein [Leptolyngbya ectocarpi]MBE9065234.1 RMD1 family protein [Leptolyngbya cf. ectocarpi LEGE 11479]
MGSLTPSALPSTDLPQLSPVPLGWTTDDRIVARAHLVGERLVLKTLETTAALSTNPLIVRAGASGCAVLLRYGVVVVFNLDPTEEAQYLDSLTPFIKEPSAEPVFEELILAFRPDAKERLEQANLWLKDCSAERLQIVAEALAKSVVLDYYEQKVSSLFAQIKPFTTAIQDPHQRPPKEKELLRYIGGTLLIQQKMLGIVEVGDKPDPIWDFPDLNRLYLRLEDEYELRERLLILEQKLSLISRSVETALGILQQGSSHRVEWYIVILIVVEILLAVYELWLQ